MKKHVSFVKSPEQLAALEQTDCGAFYCQEKLQMFWFVEEDVYKRILPPGLEPVFPMVIAYISNFGRPGQLYPYTEGALFVLASHDEEVGCYCLAMPLDGNDQAQDAGRELYGYPKKAARVKLARRGNTVEGWIERNDVRILSVKAEIGAFNDEVLGNQLIGIKEPEHRFLDCVYLLDYNLNAFAGELVPEKLSFSLDRFEDIKLVKQTNDVTIHTQEPATILTLQMEESEDDPWAELAPAKLIGAEYCRYTTKMKGCQLRRRYTLPEELKAVYPHLFARWDAYMFGSYHASYKAGNFYR